MPLKEVLKSVQQIVSNKRPRLPEPSLLHKTSRANSAQSNRSSGLVTALTATLGATGGACSGTGGASSSASKSIGTEGGEVEGAGACNTLCWCGEVSPSECDDMEEVVADAGR